MANAPEEVDRLAQAGARAIRQRNLALSARDCLPPDRDPDRTTTKATPRPLAPANEEALKGSMLAQAPPQAPKSGVEELKLEARDRLAPLLGNDRVRRALEAGPTEPDVAADALWAAGSLALELSVEDIEALPGEVPEIAGVYPNRRLRIPPVVEVLNVPEAVREARAASYGVEKIGALAAWGAHDARGAGVKVGILDSGVDIVHSDLLGKVVAWAEFDADGVQVPNSVPHDSERHGTHVAGTIAGGAASGQWIGVAPEAELCCAQVMGPGGGTDKQLLAGLSWVIEQGVDVISMSLGGLTMGPEMPATYTEAILSAVRQGIPAVIAIGNDGSQTSGSPGNDLFALGVGATDHLDRPAGFSGGRTQVVSESDFINPELLPLPYSKPEVSAPGITVASSVPGDTWAVLSGTSMATPHVAGAIAVLLSATTIRQQVEAAERALLISDLVVGSVEELGEAGQDHRYGFGRIDVLRAIDFARERGY
jgi:subtilisin family serine protease